MLFMQVYANNSGGVTSDGGSRASKRDLPRERNRGLGAQAGREALNSMRTLPREGNRGLSRKSGRRGARK